MKSSQIDKVEKKIKSLYPQKIVIKFSMMSTRNSAKKKFLFVAIFVSGLWC